MGADTQNVLQIQTDLPQLVEDFRAGLFTLTSLIETARKTALASSDNAEQILIAAEHFANGVLFKTFEDLRSFSHAYALKGGV